jgi:hypothetical protein
MQLSEMDKAAVFNNYVISRAIGMGFGIKIRNSTISENFKICTINSE